LQNNLFLRSAKDYLVKMFKLQKFLEVNTRAELIIIGWRGLCPVPPPSVFAWVDREELRELSVKKFRGTAKILTEKSQNTSLQI